MLEFKNLPTGFYPIIDLTIMNRNTIVLYFIFSKMQGFFRCNRVYIEYVAKEKAGKAGGADAE